MLLTNWHEELSLHELLDESTGDGSTDLELFAENGSGNAKNLRNLLEHSLELSLIEVDGIIKLFLNLNLSPALLLGLATFTSSFLLGQLGAFGRRLSGIFATNLLFFRLKDSKDS